MGWSIQGNDNRLKFFFNEKNYQGSLLEVV